MIASEAEADRLNRRQPSRLVSRRGYPWLDGPHRLRRSGRAALSLREGQRRSGFRGFRLVTQPGRALLGPLIVVLESL